MIKYLATIMILFALTATVASADTVPMGGGMEDIIFLGIDDGESFTICSYRIIMEGGQAVVVTHFSQTDEVAIRTRASDYLVSCDSRKAIIKPIKRWTND